MIPGYSDHAANERTFLAWVRTGVAVVAFGFVIEKFNLILLTIESTQQASTKRHVTFEALLRQGSRYEGLAVTLLGLALIVAASLRFVRIRRLLSDRDAHDVDSYRSEIVLSTALAALIAASSLYVPLIW